MNQAVDAQMEATDKVRRSEMMQMFGPMPAEDTKVRDVRRKCKQHIQTKEPH